MSGMLDVGDRLTTDSGDDVEVTGMLGSGGQGEVYRVRTPHGDKALKWYFPSCATPEQRKIVEELVSRDFDDRRFLWPHAVVTGGGSGFGYLMDIRPDRFRSLPDLFRRRLRTTPTALVTAGLNTVGAYQTLHSRGIAYRDISGGNIFFDPANGDVLVCDNDNAVVEGEASGISGTMEFMAPELVRGDPGAIPGTQTDLHSLSVLLFMLLMNHHPLKGRAELAIRCLDEAAEKKLYGRNPVFVFDPDDGSNAPDPQEQSTVLATWGVLPPVLRTLFVRNLTQGLRDPSRRVRETEWCDALRAVRDTIVDCAGCGRQNMTEPTSVRARDCWYCRSTLVLPPRLVITTAMLKDERHLRLRRSARVHAHHLRDEPATYDYGDDTVVAELVEHPQKPGRFGLANRSATTWSARRSDGTAQDVAPGRTVPLRSGLEIDLGGARAVVHAE
ncbi:protein kinase domain-containing protein [Streptomyces sp. URMC 126]|uniref:protein kinase domain-containing protein n=1 Tax=Streptomyces sp. URMC 126 TaxID=3423401 RepID=UPI003F1D1CB0